MSERERRGSYRPPLGKEHGMEPGSLSDEELLDELRAAHDDVVRSPDPEKRRAAWERVIVATRELERRYPPASEPLS